MRGSQFCIWTKFFLFSNGLHFFIQRLFFIVDVFEAVRQLTISAAVQGDVSEASRILVVNIVQGGGGHERLIRRGQRDRHGRWRACHAIRWFAFVAIRQTALVQYFVGVQVLKLVQGIVRWASGGVFRRLKRLQQFKAIVRMSGGHRLLNVIIQIRKCGCLSWSVCFQSCLLELVFKK